jgi:hypothetical protein
MVHIRNGKRCVLAGSLPYTKQGTDSASNEKVPFEDEAQTRNERRSERALSQNDLSAAGHRRRCRYISDCNKNHQVCEEFQIAANDREASQHLAVHV